jgi:hypothetical protein
VAINVGGTIVRFPGPEDHLRLFCLHLLSHGAWRPLWLCDVAAAFEARPSGFDWDYFFSGGPLRSRWTLSALDLAEALLGITLQDVPRHGVEVRTPSWIRSAVLRQWGTKRRHREPLMHHLRAQTESVKVSATAGLIPSWQPLKFEDRSTDFRDFPSSCSIAPDVWLTLMLHFFRQFSRLVCRRWCEHLSACCVVRRRAEGRRGEWMMGSDTPVPGEKANPDPLPRKPYQSPKLTIYGDIREITQTSTAMGMKMDMITGMSKTG